MSFRKVTVGSSGISGIVAYADTVIDDSDSCPALLSISGYSKQVSSFCKRAKHPGELTVQRKNSAMLNEYSIRKNTYKYRIYQEKDLAHAVVYKEDTPIYTRSGEHSGAIIYIFTNNISSDFDISYRRRRYNIKDILHGDDDIPEFPEELIKKAYHKLYKNSPVPLKEEWIDYILCSFIDSYKMSELRTDSEEGLRAFKINVDYDRLFSIVSQGLANQVISINGSHEPSSKIYQIQGLDSYLNEFKNTLYKTVKNSFTSRFDPKSDCYSKEIMIFDEIAREKGTGLYDAQKGVADGVARALKEKDTALIVGEMGVGKTPCSLGAIYASQQGKGNNTIVLCPGHLVEKWKNEIDYWMPSSRSVIIHNFKELLNIENEIKNTERREHLFLIFSGDTAKNSYAKQPAAKWSRLKEAFICPDCGSELYYTKIVNKGQRNERKEKFPLGRMSFRKEMADNINCKECNSNLWQPISRNSEWLKLGSAGWFLRRHIEEDASIVDGDRGYIPRYLRSKEDLTKTDREILGAIGKYHEGDMAFPNPSKDKYNSSWYIKKRLKGYINFFVADEIHEYEKKTSQRGEAFGALVAASDKVIGLTGTLLNGYAEGIFYLLYRCFPGLMKREGFDFSNSTIFSKAYGVEETCTPYRQRDGERTSKAGPPRTQFRPGISPLVFSRFLMETTAFITLDDIAEGLPNYTEIPVGVDMEPDLQSSYENLESGLRDRIRSRRGSGRGGIKVMGSALQTLLSYPDTPRNQPPIVHPDTGEILITPVDLEADGLSNKEQEALRLVEQHVSQGERVIIYYEFSNRTDAKDRLLNILRERDYKVASLESNTVKSEKRDAWIKDRVKKDNIDVLLVHPTLVQTGLDLVDFTSIIFYQLGYKLFTLRQASRRTLRVTQDKDVNVYFLFYRGTMQERTLSLMANKLQASTAIEGKFSEEGLHAMSNTGDLFTELTNSLVEEGVQRTVSDNIFSTRNFLSAKGVHYDLHQRLGEGINDLPVHYKDIDINSMFRSKIIS